MEYNVGDKVKIIKHTDDLEILRRGMCIRIHPDDVGIEGTITVYNGFFNVYLIHFDNQIAHGSAVSHGYDYCLTEEFIELTTCTEFDLDELYKKFY